MTTFKDYLANVHLSDEIEVDFTTWHESLSRKDFAWYFKDYLRTLSTIEESRVAEVILENQ